MLQFATFSFEESRIPGPTNPLLKPALSMSIRKGAGLLNYLTMQYQLVENGTETGREVLRLFVNHLVWKMQIKKAE